MKKLIFFLLAITSLSSSVSSQERSSKDYSAIVDMMIAAKATGMCGVFVQMAIFQESTKMPGGDEFIVRFFNTEAVRLGHTLESFTKQCSAVVNEYNSNMKLLGYE